MTTLDNLTDKIMEEVNNYTDEIKKELEQRLDRTADEIIEYIKENAPRSGREEVEAFKADWKNVKEIYETLVGKNYGRLLKELKAMPENLLIKGK